MIQTYTPLPAPVTKRSPTDIAADIRQHMPTGGTTWNFCRVYVQGMGQLLTWTDRLGSRDSLKEHVTFPSQVAHMGGREVATRFLCNAGAWRGEHAKRIKDELRRALRGEA